MSNNIFENRAVYEIMSKNVVEPEAADDNKAHARCMLVEFLPFHGNNGFVNAPHCCVIRTLPVL
jgi:hypothetical protein